MNTLVAFNGSPDTKMFYIRRVRAHREADELVRGTGFESTPNGVRGCGIGCTLHTYDHSKYPSLLGVPEQLAYLEDWLFEHLPSGHLEWPERFLDAIRPGADLDGVWPALVCRMLGRRLIDLGEGDEAWRKQCRLAIGRVRDLYEHGMPAARAAEAAWAAARAAWAAGDAAMAAWDAAWAAGDAAWAAWAARAAAMAARAAGDAAEAAEITRMADDLIELLAAA